MSQTLIEASHVTMTYEAGAAPQLSGVDLSLGEGEFLCLVGPSGCGKSTLLRLIAGVLQPTEGTITVFGQHHIPGWSNLSFVPQDAALLPWRNVLDNVKLPLELYSGLNPCLIRQKAQAALALVNLTGVDAKYPHQLSGGMRQRVALARALVSEARVILLDEPFAALDAITRSQMHLELLRIRNQTGLSLMLVTHNIFEAVFLADRVLVMGEKPGRIMGTIPITLPNDRSLKLLGTPEFSRLVGAVQTLLEQGWSDYYDR